MATHRSHLPLPEVPQAQLQELLEWEASGREQLELKKKQEQGEEMEEGDSYIPDTGEKSEGHQP